MINLLIGHWKELFSERPRRVLSPDGTNCHNAYIGGAVRAQHPTKAFHQKSIPQLLTKQVFP